MYSRTVKTLIIYLGVHVIVIRTLYWNRIQKAFCVTVYCFVSSKDLFQLSSKFLNRLYTCFIDSFVVIRSTLCYSVVISESFKSRRNRQGSFEKILRRLWLWFCNISVCSQVLNDYQILIHWKNIPSTNLVSFHFKLS